MNSVLLRVLIEILCQRQNLIECFAVSKCPIKFVPCYYIPILPIHILYYVSAIEYFIAKHFRFAPRSSALLRGVNIICIAYKSKISLILTDVISVTFGQIKFCYSIPFTELGYWVVWCAKAHHRTKKRTNPAGSF